uniref:NADH-ubiquinone oxidoreductase chain 2 n=1 Tax=Glycera cf. oxycephala FS21 TaxID=1763831 RepID=A0A0U2X2H0_9ANNE|nr:NADH dehydrogenase subunit 2 [Glycera cf. oxycephala FS21]
MPYYTLFSLTLFTGTLMSLSSNHWIYVWMGFEMNLMSFIPMILHSNSNQETEAAVKYFLTQALGSSMILLAALSISFSSFSVFSSNLMMLMITFSLMVKMGAAPFHFWLPQVMMSISWTSCMILATWQKIAPLFIIASISSTLSNKFMMSLGAIGAIIGGLGGLNQTHLRPLLAYSSISHLGWMMSATCISMYSTTIYFSIYALTTLSIMLIMYFNTTKSNYISSLTNTSLALSSSLMILFLSLGGLPPLLGFFPKWIMIKSMIAQNMMMFTTFMILGSLISLFYYMSLFFNMYTNYSMEMYKNKASPSLMISTTIIATMTLGLIPMIM